MSALRLRKSTLIAMLLFGSGSCALIYQTAWLRELRLVFGASTPASAAVLGVFMGGLGLGSYMLGGKADKTDRPLKLYANLELWISVAAALTPALLWLARSAYIALGGAMRIGIGAGTVLRLLLAAVVLLPPTFLMGGTLPAAARAATATDDAGRRATALLYGANTIGAVVGATVTTFLLLEVFGTRLSLWLGCTLNALVAMLARGLDRSFDAMPPEVGHEDASEHGEDDVEQEGDVEQGEDVDEDENDELEEDEGEEEDVAKVDEAPSSSLSPAHGPFVLVAAAVVGLVFLQLELVWYRMLSPLLGGSTYTFGLILAVALTGIGVGGLLYNQRKRQVRPTLVGFALTCGLEALFVVLPLALGDRIALLALYLRPLGATGLFGHAVGWSLITAIVVLPTALVAGYQFPLLIGLLGSGRGGIGRHVGIAYATNTVGSIIGSIATGFIIVPLLGAVNTWAMGAWMLVALGVAALVLHERQAGLSRQALAPAVIVVVVAATLVSAPGPTAVWRHTPIANGRVDHAARLHTRNELRKFERQRRRAVIWETDGRESSVALLGGSEVSFYINGKADGSAAADATTQVMGGLLGAILHDEPKRFLVIGLGTGASAGWLGKLPNVEAVDVIEIEPAILDVARDLAAVNENVLDNPKVNITVGDAREILLTTPHQYDVIFSEPSNPYRSGISSLFTHEFYEAVRGRLRPGGLFLQWLQGYDIDPQSVRTVYTTLHASFPSIQSWRTDVVDLFLVARQEEKVVDMGLLRRRVTEEPYRRALNNVWGNGSAEAVLSHWVAAEGLPRALVQERPGGLNTDDRNLLEFGLARSLGRPQTFSVEQLRVAVANTAWGRPPVRGDVDWGAVTDARSAIGIVQNGVPEVDPPQDPDALRRYEAFRAWGKNRSAEVLRHWTAQPRPPTTRVELLVVADAYAAQGDAEHASPLIEKLRVFDPVEASVVAARLALKQGDANAAGVALAQALVGYRTHPWAAAGYMGKAIRLAVRIAQRAPEARPRLVQALAEPFAANLHRETRARAWFAISLGLTDPQACVAALAELEPHTPWERDFLVKRTECYVRARHPLAGTASSELAEFIEAEGAGVEDHLIPRNMSSPAPTP